MFLILFVQVVYLADYLPAVRPFDKGKHVGVRSGFAEAGFYTGYGCVFRSAANGQFIIYLLFAH